MYSDMSKRTSSTPSALASCRAASVLPTPVGPANRNEPTGLSGALSPARDSLIAVDSESMAGSCPNTVSFRSRSRLRNSSLSELLTCFGGIRAILATMSSTCGTSMRLTRFASGCRRW
ncbi:hypothetical protein D3C80_1370390 [compost metagenome]